MELVSSSTFIIALLELTSDVAVSYATQSAPLSSQANTAQTIHVVQFTTFCPHASFSLNNAELDVPAISGKVPLTPNLIKAGKIHLQK